MNGDEFVWMGLRWRRVPGAVQQPRPPLSDELAAAQEYIDRRYAEARAALGEEPKD